MLCAKQPADARGIACCRPPPRSPPAPPRQRVRSPPATAGWKGGAAWCERGGKRHSSSTTHAHTPRLVAAPSWRALSHKGPEGNSSACRAGRVSRGFLGKQRRLLRPLLSYGRQPHSSRSCRRPPLCPLPPPPPRYLSRAVTAMAKPWHTLPRPAARPAARRCSIHIHQGAPGRNVPVPSAYPCRIEECEACVRRLNETDDVQRERA